MESKTKKILFPLFFIIITFILIVIGTTFAYFAVNVINNSTKININGNVDDVGSVALKSENDLNLRITIDKMMDKGRDVEYYATIGGEASETKVDVAIASINVNGDNTMKCDYILNGTIIGTSNMYDAFKNMSTATSGQLVLYVAGKEYDLYNTNFPIKVTGSTEIKGNDKSEILASFKVVNKTNINQNDLAGTDLNISFTVEEFRCEVVG